MEKMNIEIKETRNDEVQKFREYVEAEIKVEQFRNSNKNSLEKEIKRILTWIASAKQQGSLIFATLERLGDCTIMHVPGSRKEYRSHKDIEDVKEALEYISENICGEGFTLAGLDVSKMNTVKVAFTVSIRFKE